MNATDKFLTVEDASRFCADRGFPYATSTLNRLRCQGGGPRFVRMGARKIAYPQQALLDWLTSRLGPEVGSTSEYIAPQAA
jgi:hypothetical protein